MQLQSNVGRQMLQGEKNVQPDQDLNTGPLKNRIAALPTKLFSCLHIISPK
jgi:hypothetical protein